MCLSVPGSFALSHAALCLSTMLLVAASADISDINQLLKSSFRDDDDIRKYLLREFFLSSRDMYHHITQSSHHVLPKHLNQSV